MPAAAWDLPTCYDEAAASLRGAVAVSERIGRIGKCENKPIKCWKYEDFPKMASFVTTEDAGVSSLTVGVAYPRTTARIIPSNCENKAIKCSKCKAFSVSTGVLSQ